MDLTNLLTELGKGFANFGWQNAVMIGAALVLIYLAIVKEYEPVLLLPIGFGCLLANLGMSNEVGFMQVIYDAGIKTELFPLLIFIGVGVNRTFDEVPLSVSGFSYQLKEPVMIGESERDRLWIHIYNHDPAMAPEGKTSIIIILNSEYNYWKKLAEDINAYKSKKEEIASKITMILEQRYPDISKKIEVIDVATPLTFERYTGNWQGSFEGWLITPANSYVFMKPMSQQLPGLDNFYMCGQWTEPGGGLPTGIMAGQRLIRKICKEDHRKFRIIVK